MKKKKKILLFIFLTLTVILIVMFPGFKNGNEIYNLGAFAILITDIIVLVKLIRS